MDDALANYFAFVVKVDDLCNRIVADFQDQITCHAGCSDCCRHISLVWVESITLAYALSRLPADEVDAIRRQAYSATRNGPCPLLINDRCALYEHRPIICRTHGLPILTPEEFGRSVTYCHENFTGTGKLPGTAVIDTDRLNTVLDSINRLFIQDFFTSHPEQERLTIAESLLLEIDRHGDTP